MNWKENDWAFDKRVIIELFNGVSKEIARKYENIQKGVGGTMRGALIKTESKRILNKGGDEGKGRWCYG